MKNLVLIGMPGSGKTTVGRLLSRRLGLPLLDTDRMVEERTGRTIPSLFAQEGEPFFRALETAAAREAAQARGAVIATGGGLVLRPENISALEETGLLFFLDRAPEEIAGEDHQGRPLIGGSRERLFRLYEERLPLYQCWAHHTVSHTRTPEEAADQVAAIYEKECHL